MSSALDRINRIEKTRNEITVMVIIAKDFQKTLDIS